MRQEIINTCSLFRHSIQYGHNTHMIIAGGLEISHLFKIRMGIIHSKAEMAVLHHGIIIEIVSESHTFLRGYIKSILEKADGPAFVCGFQLNIDPSFF